jgi:hypothetical protein
VPSGASRRNPIFIPAKEARSRGKLLGVSMNGKWLVLAMLSLAFTEADAARAAQAIGTAAIVENKVTGAAQDAATPVPLSRGDGLFQNERIETAADGKAQLLFADQSALSMAPNSTVVLDKFIYDPKPNVGTVVLDTVAGAFRFVGGTADTVAGSTYTVKTPVGTIGIRGTLFEWEVTGDYLSAVLREGAVDVCLANQACVALTEPGTYVVTRGQHLSGIQRWSGPAGEAQNHVVSNVDQIYRQDLNSRGFTTQSGSGQSGSGGQRCNLTPTVHC